MYLLLKTNVIYIYKNNTTGDASVTGENRSLHCLTLKGVGAHSGIGHSSLGETKSRHFGFLSGYWFLVDADWAVFLWLGRVS